LSECDTFIQHDKVEAPSATEAAEFAKVKLTVKKELGN
jgi:hypothetical protein